MTTEIRTVTTSLELVTFKVRHSSVPPVLAFGPQRTAKHTG